MLQLQPHVQAQPAQRDHLGWPAHMSPSSVAAGGQELVPADGQCCATLSRGWLQPSGHQGRKLPHHTQRRPAAVRLWPSTAHTYRWPCGNAWPIPSGSPHSQGRQHLLDHVCWTMSAARLAGHDEGPAADWFSLGVLLYQLHTNGAWPFKANWQDCERAAALRAIIVRAVQAGQGMCTLRRRVSTPRHMA